MHNIICLTILLAVLKSMLEGLEPSKVVFCDLTLRCNKCIYMLDDDFITLCQPGKISFDEPDICSKTILINTPTQLLKADFILL